MPMPDKFLGRLVGKTAIVTGAGGGDHPDGDGIGSAIAQMLAGEGAGVCVVDLDADRAAYTCQRIEEKGGKAIVEAADVRSDKACRAAVERTEAELGRVDILVNSVGIGETGGIGQYDEGVWQRIIDVNLKGAVQMTRHCLPIMARQGGGAIINISSIGALRSAGSTFTYGPSKAALNAFTRDIAVGFGRSGIRVNAICPGHMFTPIVSNLDDMQRERRRKIAPLGIKGDAWDIASLALFLAGDEARFISGTVIPVDGGVIAVSPIKGADFLAD